MSSVQFCAWEESGFYSLNLKRLSKDVSGQPEILKALIIWMKPANLLSTS